MDDFGTRLAALDREVDALLEAYRAALAKGDHAEGDRLLDQRSEIARLANTLRRQVEQTKTVAAVRLALAGCLTALDVDEVAPITATRAGLKLPGGITIRLSH